MQATATEERYVIGVSSNENMIEAVDRQINGGPTPLVGEEGARRTSYTNEMECYSYLLISKLVSQAHLGVIHKMNEGCNADISYHSSLDEKQAMGIQLKTTGKARQDGRGFYSFAMDEKEYPGKLMIFHSLLEGLAWVIPYGVVIQYYHKGRLKIRQSNEPGKKSNTRISWLDYCVNIFDIPRVLQKWYNTMDESQILTKFSIDELNIPTGRQAQIEHEYRNRIMDILGKTGLPINTPPLEMGTSDLIFGTIRLQEKVGYIFSNLQMKMMVNFHRSGVVPYHEDDFDILIVHYPEPYQRQFCFIPMWELVNHGLVSTSQSSGKTALYVYIDRSHVENIWGWIEKYSLHYDQPDLNERILAIYNSAINPPVAPVTETEQYVIGISSVSGIFQAVCNELDHQIHPRIANRHIPTRVVDYYSILLNECVTRSGQGIIETIPGSQGVYYRPHPDNEYCLVIIFKMTQKIKSRMHTNHWEFKFTQMDNYDGYLVFLRCISDGASWLVSYTYLGQFKAGVRIPEEYTSLTRGKWNQDRIYESEIGPQLLHIYQNPQANGVKLYRIKDVLELRRGQTLK